jgi:hypothetical protein
MDCRGLIRIGRDFNLLGIESPSIPSIHMVWSKTEQALNDTWLCLPVTFAPRRALPAEHAHYAAAMPAYPSFPATMA